jgi:hypothetical protein
MQIGEEQINKFALMPKTFLLKEIIVICKELFKVKQKRKFE